MALTTTSVNQLNQLLAVLQSDASACEAVEGAARRRLSPSDFTILTGVIGKDASGVDRSAGQSALTTLLADIAANA